MSSSVCAASCVGPILCTTPWAHLTMRRYEEPRSIRQVEKQKTSGRPALHASEAEDSPRKRNLRPIPWPPPSARRGIFGYEPSPMTRKSYDLQNTGSERRAQCHADKQPVLFLFRVHTRKHFAKQGIEGPRARGHKKMERAETRSISSCDHARAALFYFWKVRMPA